MPDLKKLATPPAGSLPPGLLNKIIVMVSTILVLALILSSLCNGGEDGATPATQQPSGAEPSVDRPVDTDLQAAIDLQQRRADAQRRAEDREAQALRLAEQRRLAEVALAVRNPPGAQSILQPDSEGNLPDPEAIELLRQLDLEELERRITSVRAGPVAQSLRDPRRTATGGEEDRAAPAYPTDPTQALLRAIQPSVLGTAASPPAGELDIPLPNSANLPEYENPPRLIDPDDPAGWERVYEGSFLEAVLVNQLTGEFPGPALAIVTVPFYSADRQRVLIPRGSRLIGTAQAVRRRPQARLAVGFHRLVLLDGRHVPLRFLGLSQSGESGLYDQVDRHYMSTFLAAGAIGLISGLALYQGSPYSGGAGGLLSTAGTGVAGSGQQMLEPFLNRLPTVTIRAGHRLRVWFTSDLLIPRSQP